jgi:hypothetical protein
MVNTSNSDYNWRSKLTLKTYLINIQLKALSQNIIKYDLYQIHLFLQNKFFFIYANITGHEKCEYIENTTEKYMYPTEVQFAWISVSHE